MAVLDVAPNRFQSWDLKPTDYGLPADASPEQVAAMAEKGDLYLMLPAKEGPTADWPGLCRCGVETLPLASCPPSAV